MKRRKGKNRIWPYFLLAALCIAGMELLFCSYFAPADFRRITRPLVQAVADVRQSVQDAMRGMRAARYAKDMLRLSAEASALPFPLEFPPAQVAEEPPVLPTATPVPADPVITQFSVAGDGRETLTGGAFPCVYYNQKEAPWASMPFGGDTIDYYGCGPVAMSMVVSSMTETKMDPGQMAAWAAAHDYWAPQSGSYHTFIADSAIAFGLQPTRMGACTPDQMIQSLLRGDMFVALMGPGHFTNSGHFIVLRGATLSGEILIADPNSRENSLTTWDPQQLLGQVSQSDGRGLLLWRIAAPAPTL